MVRKRGYRLIKLDQAMTDAAYEAYDGHTGSDDISWLYRWTK